MSVAGPPSLTREIHVGALAEASDRQETVPLPRLSVARLGGRCRSGVHRGADRECRQGDRPGAAELEANGARHDATVRGEPRPRRARRREPVREESLKRRKQRETTPDQRRAARSISNPPTSKSQTIASLNA